jgi:hypothetical protein
VVVEGGAMEKKYPTGFPLISRYVFTASTQTIVIFPEKVKIII